MDVSSGAVARIPLKGMFILVDAADAPVVNAICWQLTKAKCGRWYVTHGVVGALSRLLMDAPDGMHVDHINGDTLDNRRANLRICTHQQNQWNRKRSPGKSRFKGVTFCKNNNYPYEWSSRVECNAKRHFLGYFATPLAAALAYDDAAAELFGKYAGLNFPERHRNLGEPNPNALLKSRAQRRWKNWKTA